MRAMIQLAWRNLRTRPVRSLLALCGLTVAIAGMVGLFSVAEGLESTFRKTFDRIPGLIVMQPGAPIPLFSRLPAAWGDELRALPGVRRVNPEVWARAHLVNGKPTISPPRFLFGTTIPETVRLQSQVYRDNIVSGRFLVDADTGSRNVVISRQIAEEFKVDVGGRLVVDGLPLDIVGIYHTGSLLLDIAILMDINEVRKAGRVSADTVCVYYIEPLNVAENDALIQRVRETFRGRPLDAWNPASASAMEFVADASPNPFLRAVLAIVGGFSNVFATPRPAPPRDDSPEPSPASADSSDLPLEVRSAADYADELRKISADLDLFLLIMTSIGVVIAVLGIVNTMLMSVTERFIEFGILKANGWSDRDVLTLICCESALLGLGGGVLGAASGWAATELVNARWPDRIHLYASPPLLAFSLAFSLIVGVLGGLYPAIWASRLMPMDAIRRG
jgi:putative ABC transport system permease protein